MNFVNFFSFDTFDDSFYSFSNLINVLKLKIFVFSLKPTYFVLYEIGRSNHYFN